MCLLNNRRLKQVLLRRLSLFIGCLLILGNPATLLAQETYPQCFPEESAWENIEFETPPAARQASQTAWDGRELIFTPNRFESYLPHLYGFAFAKKDLPSIPELTVSSSVEEQFRDVSVISLGRPQASEVNADPSYRFVPSSKGPWVIYLVAAMDQIPFLEQKNLRISSKIEKVRGGSIFSGSSLNLVEPIDYKACVIGLGP